MNPELASVAECLNSDHTVLFKGSNNVSLVYTFRMSNNLIVQEAQDPGVGMLAHAITSNQIRGTLISTVVGDNLDASPGYGVVAKKLLDHGLNLVGVIKDDDIHVMFSDLDLSSTRPAGLRVRRAPRLERDTIVPTRVGQSKREDPRIEHPPQT